MEIRQISSKDGSPSIYVEGLTSFSIENLNDAKSHISKGKQQRYHHSNFPTLLIVTLQCRATGSTNSNEHSSRSHSVVLIQVYGRDLKTNERVQSKLYLIDLAG